MLPDISIQQTEAGQKRIQSFAFVIGASAAVCIALYFALLSFSVSGQSRDACRRNSGLPKEFCGRRKGRTGF
jgi:hypothetical protein